MDLKRIFTGYWVVPLSWLFLIFFLYSWFGKAYTNDSFAYYALGKNLFSGNGFTTTFVRDFYIQTVEPWYSRSFPPLYPILVGLTDRITGAQIASGLLINLVILFFILHVTYSMSTKVPGARGHFLFLAVFLFMCCNKPFINEVVQAGALPLTLLLVLCVAHFLTWKRYFKGLSSSICIGALLGLIMLTRFDTALFCFLFPLIYLFDAKDKLKKTFHAYSGLLIVICPWLIRNHMVFGTWFAADHTPNIFSIMTEPTQLSFYKNGYQTFSDGSSLWIYQRFENLMTNINIFFKQIGIAGLALLMLLLGITIQKIRDRQPWSSVHLLAFVWVTCNFVTVSLTPYHGGKLFSITILLLLFCLIHDLIRINNKSMILKPSLSTKARIAWAFGVTILMLGTMHYLKKPLYAITPKLKDHYEDIVENFQKNLNDQSMVACTDAEILNYFSNWRTIDIPHNTHQYDENFIAWMKHWKVSHLIVTKDSKDTSPEPFLDSKKVKVIDTFGPYHLLDLKNLY